MWRVCIHRTLMAAALAVVALMSHLTQAGMHMQEEEHHKCDKVRTKVVAYEDLLGHGLAEFSRHDATDFSQLVVDYENDQLIVGAKDLLLQLNLDDLSILQETEWKPSDLMVDICQSKGEREEDCCNFVRVLLPYQDKIFTCGTNAFSPLCTWRKRTNVTEVESELSGIARCPYDPKFNATALLTKEGDLYSGTVMDFTARDPVVYRTLGPSPALRTAQLNAKWLSEPSFVSSYEIDSYVYFFFREVAVEKSSCGKVIYSRVARVCKNDVGGEYLLEENWTTFIKARLNCTLPDNLPSQFDQLQSTFFSEETRTVYGVFSASGNGMHGSAVCSFRLTDIEETFKGSFKFQPDPWSAWISQPNPNPNFNCSAVDNGNNEIYLNEDHLLAAQKYQLMDQAVPPEPSSPMVVSTSKHYRLDHILVDHIEGKDEKYDMIFLGTSNGRIKKVFKIPGKSDVCVLEDMCATPKSKCDPIKTMKLHEGRGALYVGLPNAIVKIPVQRCLGFVNEQECIESRDPYCGWNEIRNQCTTKPESQVELNRWHQNITSCPVLSNSVDGGFGDWSEWFSCDDPSGELASCLCRTRECNTPAPQCGGATCQGERVQVKNCSDRRGQLEESMEQEDNWSPWTEWSLCTQRCGGGVQSRDRRCLDGSSCIGSNHELRVCNTHRCVDRRKSSVWTPWLLLNVSETGLLQQRFRFICRAPVEDRLEISLSSPKNQVRVCPFNSNKCIGNKYADNFGGWSAWSPWLPCSVTCGEGTQVRHRSCFPGSTECFGHYYEQRKCSTAAECPVDGGWGCWSEWSECSVTCGSGIKTRDRYCNNPVPQNEGLECEGLASQKKECYAGECDDEQLASSLNWGIEVRSGPRGEDPPIMASIDDTGWKTWSKWSKCGIKGKRHRSRKCSIPMPTPGVCEGCVKEIQWCYGAVESIEATPLRPDVQRLVAPESPACLSAKQESEQELVFLFVVAILSAIAGAIIAVSGYISWQRKHDKSNKVEVEVDDYGDDIYDEEDIFQDDEFPFEDYTPPNSRPVASNDQPTTSTTSTVEIR